MCGRAGPHEAGGAGTDYLVIRSGTGQSSPVLAGLDPAEVDRAGRRGDGLPPTVIALSAAIGARLRELAADGPFVTELDGSPVVIELDGPLLVEHPLVPPDDEATP